MSSSINCLNIGIDLGSDTLKLAFVYRNPQKGLIYGKFSNPDITQSGLPAQAQYVQSNGTGKWIFADQIAYGDGNSFITVVKIKKLISLLSKVTGGDTDDDNLAKEDRNRKYYEQKNVFPKFAFPDKRQLMLGVDVNDFATYEATNNVFVADGYTPKRVCEDFFKYIASYVEQKIEKLEQQMKCVFPRDKISYTVVYPPKVGVEYIDEVIRLVNVAFKKKPSKFISSTKALAFYAYHEKLLDNGDNALFFDLGEETISVAKAHIEKSNFVVDGTDGHMLPRDFGGADIDEAIAAYLDDQTSHGKNIGGINEQMLYSKQYELVNDIKCVKSLISDTDFEKNFPRGISVNVEKEVSIRCQCTKEAIMECLIDKKSISTKKGKVSVGEHIADYIKSEIKLPVNGNTKKLFLAGGLSEFKPLMNYLSARIKEVRSDCQVYMYDLRESEESDEFAFSQLDDGVYAAAIGGALVAYLNYDIKTVYSLSYGTLVRKPGKGYKFFDILVSRGAPSDGNNSDYGKEYQWVLSPQMAGKGGYHYSIPDGVMYTCAMSKNEIGTLNIPGLTLDMKKKFFINEIGEPFVLIDPISVTKRDTNKEDEEEGKEIVNSKLAHVISFRPAKTRHGEENRGAVYFYYKNRRAIINGQFTYLVLSAKSGLTIDLSGRAKRFIKNLSPRGTKVRIKTYASNNSVLESNEITVDLADLEFRFAVAEEFSIENDD